MSRKKYRPNLILVLEFIYSGKIYEKLYKLCTMFLCRYNVTLRTLQFEKLHNVIKQYCYKMLMDYKNDRLII